jgi:hypothetical protein
VSVVRYVVLRNYEERMLLDRIDLGPKILVLLNDLRGQRPEKAGRVCGRVTGVAIEVVEDVGPSIGGMRTTLEHMMDLPMAID